MERDYLSSLLNLFRKRINKIFVGLLVIIIAACDFESPSDFVVPTWFIDIKLPLVSKRFPMGDLVDTANFIYPTEDSAGFQILFTDLIDPPVSTEEMELAVRFPNGYMEQEIPPGPIQYGPNVEDVEIPMPNLPPIDTTFSFPSNFPLPETTLVLGVQSLFTLPVDTPTVMFSNDYNQYIVTPMNTAFNTVFAIINNLPPIDLPLESLENLIPDSIGPQITIDSLIISGSKINENTPPGIENSYLKTEFENHGFPTPLDSCSAFFISIDEISEFVEARDTMAYHFRLEVGNDPVNDILDPDVYAKTTDLADSALTDIVQLYTYFQLDSAPPNSFVTLYPTNDGEMFIGYFFDFGFHGIDMAVISVDSFNIPLDSELESMQSQLNFSSSLPEMEGISFDIKEAEIQSSGFPDPGEEPMPNQFRIDTLKSTFHWDMNFRMKIPNFVSPAGDTLISIDKLLKKGVPFNTAINLYPGKLIPIPPDTTIGSVDLDLQVWIPEQQLRIPLDGSPLGDFQVTIRFGSLFFEELKAFVNMDLSADTMEIAGFPPELTGIGFPEMEFEFELFNEIDFPLLIDIEMNGIKPNGDSVVSKLNAKLGTPSYINSISSGAIDVDIVKTKILWSNSGTMISFYAPADDSQAVEVTLIPPEEGEVSIIDFFGSMPLVAHADIKTRINGTAGITGDASQIWGNYKMKLPFAVTMNAPPFIPPTGISKLPEFSPDNRNKIRHSLIHSELATTVENSLPLGGDFAILLSNESFFPKDITDKALNDSALIDMMISNGIIWHRPIPYADPNGNSLSTDRLYIVDDCDILSPGKDTIPELGINNIYIFNVMNDSSQCVDGARYLVKHSDFSEVDTVISYVDTLFRVLLPSPDSLYQETNSEGHKGQVAVPGLTSYSSVIDTGRIFLLTDYGDHYIVPRFSFNQTGDEGVFFSRYDAIDIKSFITFRVASTGVLGPTENDIVLKFPNGGENLDLGDSVNITWETYGDVSTFDVHYASGANPTEDDWETIVSGHVSNDSITEFRWAWSLANDLYRVRIKDSNSDLQDISGWYFSVSGGSGVNTSDGNEVINKTSDGNEVINNSKMKKPGKLNW